MYLTTSYVCMMVRELTTASSLGPLSAIKWVLGQKANCVKRCSSLGRLYLVCCNHYVHLILPSSVPLDATTMPLPLPIHCVWWNLPFHTLEKWSVTMFYCSLWLPSPLALASLCHHCRCAELLSNLRSPKHV